MVGVCDMSDYIHKDTRADLVGADTDKSWHLSRDEDYNPFRCGELIKTGEVASYQIGSFHVFECATCGEKVDQTYYDAVWIVEL